MAAGNQPDRARIDDQLTQLARMERNQNHLVKDFAAQVTKLGSGGLQALGYSSSEADQVLLVAGYFSTLAGVYYGTVQQGGTGGTGATLFPFDDALTPYWAFG